MFNWLYNNIFAPVGNAIGSAFNWIGDNIVAPVHEFIHSNITQPFGEAVANFFDNLDQPGGLGDLLTGGAYTTNETNRQIAAENLAYQREENEIIRQREDTAVQRAAADMQAAGLSQTLAAGHPASTTATVAPHNDFQMQPIDKLGALLKMASVFQQLKTSDALAQKYSAEAAGQNLSNGVFAEGFATEQAVKKANIELSLADASYKKSLDSLNQIKGKTYGDYLLAELDNLRTNTKLTNEEIAYKIAQKEHLGKDDEKILNDILESVARIKNYEHDLAYAKKYNLPVGSIPGGLLGGTATTGYSIGSRIKSWLYPFLNKVILPDSISASDFGGGNAW